MVRGCFIYDKKYSNYDLKNITINYIKLIRPTEPIIQINYKNVNKYYPLIRRQFINEMPNNNINYEFNNKLNNKINLRKYYTYKDKTSYNNISSPYKNNNENNNNNYNKEIMKKKNKIPMPKNYFQLNNNNETSNNNYNNIFEKENNINFNNKIDKDGLSMQFKKKIYDWLVDVGIIKDKIIKIESLPTLCINGVLLCDLVNRCEGKNEILKGIIRKTSTRSQIQVNINKVLEYLRSLEKFPSRHLWNNIEISKGNSLIIWELLDDIYNYYGNKIKFYRRKINNNKNKLNKTFTKEKNNYNSLDNNKGDFNFNNFYSNTPLKNSKLAPININNEELNNKNNFSKYTHTPLINKNKNIEDKINNNNFNNKTFEINKNNVNKKIYNKYNNKKIFKKEKNFSINNIDLNYKNTESSYRNNLNHTNDNINESKMFTADNFNNNNNFKNSKIKKSNIDTSYRKNFDISSFYSDKFFNIEKNNKSFSVNNGINNKKRKFKNSLNRRNYSRFNINNNNQSF